MAVQGIKQSARLIIWTGCVLLIVPAPFHGSALAACTTSGTSTTCDASAPNPWTTRIGDGELPAEDNRSLDFTILGSIFVDFSFVDGNDILRIYTGSAISGAFDGGAGSDTLYLSGGGTGTLSGTMPGFEAFVKDGLGTWTLSSAIVGPST